MVGFCIFFADGLDGAGIKKVSRMTEGFASGLH